MSGRMANGPAGRKCCTARERCGFSWRTVVTMPTCAIAASRPRRCRPPRAGASRARPPPPAAAARSGGRRRARTTPVLGGDLASPQPCRRCGRCRAGVRALQEGRPQPLVLHDVGGGLAALHGVVVGDEHRAEGVVEARIGDVDRRHRLGMRRRAPPRRRARRAAAWSPPRAAEARASPGPAARRLATAPPGRPRPIAARRPQRVGQRAGQRQADRAAADDERHRRLPRRTRRRLVGSRLDSSSCTASLAGSCTACAARSWVERCRQPNPCPPSASPSPRRDRQPPLHSGPGAAGG